MCIYTAKSFKNIDSRPKNTTFYIRTNKNDIFKTRFQNAFFTF